LASVAIGQIEEGVDIGDADRVGSDAGTHDLVAGLDASLGDDSQIETRSMVGDEQRRQLRFAQAHTDAETRDPRLRHFEFGLADAVPVTNTDFVVGEAADGEVLAELTELKVVAAKVLLPVLVRADLVDQHRALLAAVPVQIALPVAIDVEPADHAGTGHRDLPNPGVDGSSLPGHVLRHADVHRK
jgi:hypothetical protein